MAGRRLLMQLISVNQKLFKFLSTTNAQFTYRIK